MRLRLYAVGTRMPAWVSAGFDEYVKRLPRELRFDLVELAAEPRGRRDDDAARLKDAEGARLLAALPGDGRIIALDERGDALDTVAWSQALSKAMQQADDLCLIIGGPDGLSSAVLARAHARWSLSALTLPHPLVRVIVAEQLYRASSLLKGHPYHRA